MQLIIQNLNFHIPHTKVQFTDVTLSFTNKKYGLVGDNGMGKSTFFKLISGVLLPHSGQLSVPSFSYLQQDPKKEQSIQDVLEITPILQALKRIATGSIDAKDYELVQHQWDLEHKLNILFDAWKISYLALNTSFSTLSGGEKTKIQIIKAIISQAELILLDEPSNHLDKQSKIKLLEWMESSKQCFIIISHDKSLLAQMDAIIELTSQGFQLYGGNYNDYCTQKAIEKASLRQQIALAIRDLSNVEKAKQLMLEKKANNVSLKKSKEKDKILKGFQKNQSEKSKSKLIKANDARIQAAHEELNDLKEKLDIKEKIKISLPNTYVPQQKIVLKIEQLDFGYPKQKALFQNFNLTITGHERLALLGDNGSGKSTLSQLITQQLKPQKGSIYLGVEHIQYLSQFGDFEDETLSIIENFQLKNPGLSIQECYSRLAQFNFRNTQAQKKIQHLSGGEKIRAGLAATLLANHPPQLLILDEPSNHLDISSLEAVKEILALYEGALIVISHNDDFLKTLGINTHLKLS